MSETKITVERVNDVWYHPNADKLDIAQVLGYHIIVSRGSFRVGDAAVFFPPDILLPTEVAQSLGVEKYLKHAVFPGDLGSSQCRVGACRLRGKPSHGFLVPVREFGSEISGPGEWGRDVTEYFGAKKYVAPVRLNAGDAVRESHNFYQYTNIENIQRGCAIEDGTEVIVTEKIHGTNVRMGLILDDTPEGQKWNYAAGSHKVRRKEGQGLYWQFMDDRVKSLLDFLRTGNEMDSIIIYGEIFGPGVQDMDYGAGVKQLRVFDISINGRYVDYDLCQAFCDSAGIKMVPALYRGPFSKEKIEELTYGPTTFEGVKCKFKGREGCVVKPVEETLDSSGNRVIYKSVSADYRNRKGAKDIE